jgi:hypothetical protein
MSIRRQALCYLELGDFKRTLELVNKGKKILVCAGIQGGEFESMLMNIDAEAYTRKTEYAQARRILEVCLHQTSPVISPIGHAYAQVNIASIDIATGTSADIISRNLDTAASTFRNVQYPRGISFCEYCRADLQLREGNTLGAQAEYIRLFASLQSSDVETVLLCLEKLADPTHPVHDDTQVVRWAVVFLAFVMRPSARNMLAVHQALRCFGDVMAQQGMDNEALSVLTVALEGFTWMDVHRSRAECMRTIGDLHLRCGEFFKAPTFWKKARPLFERSLQAKSVAEIDSRLAEMEQHDEVNLE